MYAVAMKVKEKMGVFRKQNAHDNWSAITARTQYFVNGSGPQSLVTYMKVISLIQKTLDSC